MPYPTRAIILAAGRGRRLRPHTDHTPKPLLPINGRPMLESTFIALAHAGIQEVCLITHYLAEQIEQFVGDGRPWGLHAECRRQPTLLGTADALRHAADWLTAPCMVLAADYHLPPDYLHQFKTHYVAHGSPHHIALSLKELPTAEQLAQSSSVRYEADRIVEIVEKPPIGTAPSHHAASLIYIVPAALGDYLGRAALSQRQEYELPSLINALLHDGHHALGLLQATPGEWTAIDN